MDLPLEILLLIAEIAARDESRNTKGWVADLTLVARAFKTAVDPILYYCVTIDDNNHTRLFSAASTGVAGFAMTRQLVMFMHIYIMDGDPVMTSVLAKTFAHVPYVSGRPTATMWFLLECPAPRPRALSMTGLPHPSWLTDPNEVLQAYALTHLRVAFEADLWSRTGYPAPQMLQGLTALTHLALDVEGDHEATGVIYEVFAPWLPPSVQRFLLRTRGVRDPVTFGLLLAKVARDRQDRRLWFDSRPTLPGPRSLLRSALDDARMGLALWDQGVQLYDQ
ncbi:hypothetical protein AURDEDRAFT_120759 [Auricularia subglabra TFB-10046 SS5]|nr:hypothetical protein AURDEDRAFT_120759 [Auricularia subglabra TFB-10046 SS5]